MWIEISEQRRTLHRRHKHTLASICGFRAEKHTEKALTLLVLDLALHVVDGVGGLHLQRDGLASQGLGENLQ